ncbi:udp-glucuronosyl udp-glucosyltransferase [Grosmannia clavigera kw1407]|uniref:Udp-glucuronosyl udp-glucosyltransferase n=1 Tax=Grosmannia clavigera (strain kw1407 / UAMH 11150) TaxID=655863 RepID=F0X7M3_GROCL|nr:udp-glucuronosyl udp-glucosyltransferase [Grosmannia clavigera kw1407]EFX06328.1 udp-glucuronosyl udp-glucosyltransferase [Grosmannia clavigera kw1407]
MTLTVDAVNGLSSGPAATSVGEKPYLLFCAAFMDGHTNPLIRICSGLVKRGFPVTFIAGNQHEKRIRAVGADVVGYEPELTAADWEARNAVPAGLPQLLWDLEIVFCRCTTSRWALLKETLERLRSCDPAREIVVVYDTAFMGTAPLMLGAPLPRGFDVRPKVVNVNVIPVTATSIDTGPFGPGLPPDASESGRARNQLINQLMASTIFSGLNASYGRMLREAGATVELEPVCLPHHWPLLSDVSLQMCPASLEYVRSDLPAHIRYVGSLLPDPVSPGFVRPAWWPEVDVGAAKKVVVVTQGTIATSYSDLLIPTMAALADRDDLLVVAILGVRGAALSADVAVPANARVVDYLPYEAILPRAAAFVLNAGYGGLIHGVVHGVPMVLAGSTEDKPEVAMRGQCAGVAVNLRTGQPTEAQLREAVDRLLVDPSFRDRVNEIRRENEALGAMDNVEREILRVVA